MGADRLASFFAPRSRPLVIAHRGASADAPENTLAAFALAREQGADGIELDVMRCATGEVVVFHDDDLARLGQRTTLVRDMPFDDLRRIDVGQGERIPLLDEVLARLDGMLINVELKSAPTWTWRLQDDGLVAEVISIVRRYDLGPRLMISSFDPLLLARLHHLAPELPSALLFAHDQALPYRRAWAAPLVAARAVHPESLLVDARAVAAWHARNYLVNVWTVDDAAELRFLDACGVDGVITNRPAAARSVLR